MNVNVWILYSFLYLQTVIFSYFATIFGCAADHFLRWHLF